MLLSVVSGERWPFMVGAVFTEFSAASQAAETLKNSGSRQHPKVDILEPGDPQLSQKLEPESRGVGRTLIRAHVVMGIAGVIAGLLLVGILTLAGVAAVSSNFAYACMAFGFVGGMIGLMAGGLVSIRPDHDPLINQAREACEQGQWVVLVHTKTRKQEEQAKELLSKYSGEVVSTF